VTALVILQKATDLSVRKGQVFIDLLWSVSRRESYLR
jgi:hypothetical protein